MSWHGQRPRVSVLAEMARDRERIALLLADLRERHALTQEQAAAKVGVTLRQWQRWEAGTSVPYPRNIELVAARFGIDVAEFFDPPTVIPTDAARLEAKLDQVLAELADVRRENRRLAKEFVAREMELLEALKAVQPPKRKRGSNEA